MKPANDDEDDDDDDDDSGSYHSQRQMTNFISYTLLLSAFFFTI